jgi:hypothetical protein
MWVGGHRHAPAALPQGKNTVQEAGLELGAFWIGAENLTPTGFDPRAVQPVASHYTN